MILLIAHWMSILHYMEDLIGVVDKSPIAWPFNVPSSSLMNISWVTFGSKIDTTMPFYPLPLLNDV